MVTRIERTEDSARWAAHIARTHLRRDTEKLTADLAAKADPRVISADRAAVAESRGQAGARLVDVLV
nr:hypothetical protein [uncultured Actinoplanes sp.]